MGRPILVAGGAGYVGSHTCLALSEAGYEPIVYDNFSNGHKEFVQWGPYVEGDIRDTEKLRETLAHYKPAGVLHFAALIEVGESVKHPTAFYKVNVGGAINLISLSQEAGVEAFVFSSTCATYGVPEWTPMDETHPQNPINPYGHSKLMVERVLEDLRHYSGFPSVCLRYFNAAGADPKGRIGEWHDPETHAIPIALEAALGKRAGFKLFGTDYDTRDGTCVRDYIHVLDLADAHLKALEYQLGGNAGGAFNLGTGTGTSVKELVETIRGVTGLEFAVTQEARREGDSPALIADSAKAAALLSWRPERSLEAIISDAYNWHNEGLAAYVSA